MTRNEIYSRLNEIEHLLTQLPRDDERRIDLTIEQGELESAVHELEIEEDRYYSENEE